MNKDQLTIQPINSTFNFCLSSAKLQTHSIIYMFDVILQTVNTQQAVSRDITYVIIIQLNCLGPDDAVP